MSAAAAVKWMVGRFEAHIAELPSVSTETEFAALPLRSKLAASCRLLRAAPYAIVILLLCKARPVLWEEVRRAPR